MFLWILLAIVIIADSILVEATLGTIAFFFTLAGCGIAAWVGMFNVFTFVWHDPMRTLELAASYVLVGIVWSFVKWLSFCFRKKEEVEERLKKYPTSISISVRFDPATAIPQASEYSSDILRWMGYWPFSIVGTVVGDWFLRIFKNIFRVLRSTYQAASDRIFQDVVDNHPNVS